MSMETQLCDSVNVHPLWLTFSKYDTRRISNKHKSTTNFPSMKRQWIGLKIPMHDTFILITNIIKTLHLGTNIV